MRQSDEERALAVASNVRATAATVTNSDTKGKDTNLLARGYCEPVIQSYLNC